MLAIYASNSMFHCKGGRLMKKQVLFTLAVILVLMLGACVNPNAPAGGPAPAATEAAGEEASGGESTTGVAEFHPAWPYSPPPVGHFNTYVTDGFALSIYQALMEPPFFMYRWADASWFPVAGTEWSWVDETTLQVKLIEGAVWSDGHPFTSEDVISSFNIERLLNRTAWSFLEEVRAVDDTTVEFVLNAPSNIVPRYVLRNTPITSSTVYGDFAARTAELVAQGLTPEDQEWIDLREEFNQFRPEDMVVLGPYKIDAASITESTMILNKVETSYWADIVRFDRMVNYNGETPVITPLVLSGDVDYATHGFPPATDLEFQNLGYRVIRPPVYNGPAIGFNMQIHPFEVKEFRQAIAYAINREENGEVAFGESGVPVQYPIGMSDNFVDLWLNEDVVSQINTYDYDPELAEQMLLDLGFTRDTDGVWLDDTGARMEFEFLFQAEFADWSAAAKNACEQLTAFGIACTGRAITYTQFPTEVWNGNFQLASLTWGTGQPHPHFSYSYNFRFYNPALGGSGASAAGGQQSGGDPTKPGMYFDLNVSTDAVGDVDLGALTDAAGQGADEEAQKEIIGQLALAFNEVLPMVPLWERYGNNPAPSRFAAGWLPDDDPIYLNSPYADSFVVMMILDGTLGPAGE
jgi:peptide/nickel transport system substrate-binding protein